MMGEMATAYENVEDSVMREVTMVTGRVGVLEEKLEPMEGIEETMANTRECVSVLEEEVMTLRRRADALAAMLENRDRALDLCIDGYNRVMDTFRMRQLAVEHGADNPIVVEDDEEEELETDTDVGSEEGREVVIEEPVIPHQVLEDGSLLVPIEETVVLHRGNRLIPMIPVDADKPLMVRVERPPVLEYVEETPEYTRPPSDDVDPPAY